MSLEWAAIFDDRSLAAALQQMIDKKTKQLFNEPKSFTVEDVRAFTAVKRWINEVSYDKQKS